MAMQLVINSFGSYLRKQGEGFVVKNEDKVFEVSARKVDSILITTSAYISTKTRIETLLSFFRGKGERDEFHQSVSKI